MRIFAKRTTVTLFFSYNVLQCKLPPKKDQTLVLKTNYRLMQVKVLQNAPIEHPAILSTLIKPFVFKTFGLSILEWPF